MTWDDTELAERMGWDGMGRHGTGAVAELEEAYESMRSRSVNRGGLPGLRVSD